MANPIIYISYSYDLHIVILVFASPVRFQVMSFAAPMESGASQVQVDTIAAQADAELQFESPPRVSSEGEAEERASELPISRTFNFHLLLYIYNFLKISIGSLLSPLLGPFLEI